MNISWSFSCLTDIRFSLTVVNLNSSSARARVIPGIEHNYYILQNEDTTSCDVYSFHVTAMNSFVSSGTSESITRSFPSLPDVSPVENSLHHSLAKAGDGVTLSFTFNVSQAEGSMFRRGNASHAYAMEPRLTHFQSYMYSFLWSCCSYLNTFFS